MTFEEYKRDIKPTISADQRAKHNEKFLLSIGEGTATIGNKITFTPASQDFQMINNEVIKIFDNIIIIDIHMKIPTASSTGWQTLGTFAGGFNRQHSAVCWTSGGGSSLSEVNIYAEGTINAYVPAGRNTINIHLVLVD